MDNNEVELTAVQMIQKGLAKIVATAAINEQPATHDDCVNLRKLQAQVNQAVYDLCEQCKPVETDPTGPAVCDLGNFAPKAAE